jgi:hypothetical protein
MTRFPLLLVVSLLALSPSSSRAQGAQTDGTQPAPAGAPQAEPPYRSGLASSGRVEVNTARERAADPCAGRAAKVEISSLKVEGTTVKASGLWWASPGTTHLGLEYRADGDRQVMEVRRGPQGSWDVTIPYPLCGKHVLRVYAFAAVDDDRGVQTLCFEGAPSKPQGFEVTCAPLAKLEKCSWKCSKGREPVCTGSCSVSGSGGMGALGALFGVNDAHYQNLAGPADGPWTGSVTCKPGDKVTFLVRDRSGVGTPSEKVEVDCGPAR